MNLREILEYKLITINDFSITPVLILGLVLIYVVARLILYLIRRIIKKSSFIQNRLDPGRQYAMEQFIRYIVYTIAVMMIFQNLGVNLSLIWAGSAALLVGVGLGLQQTFNDLTSGVILLVEADIEVGDVVLIDGFVGRIESIGLRACKVLTREKITIVVPNSKLISSNVINWGHESVKSARFNVKVGVAYGSDVALVTRLLEQAASEHKQIIQEPKPFVYFVDFGESSLDFELLFFSNDFLYIEKIKSELRYRIDALFREHHIQIPFPQRDIWFRNDKEG